MDLCPTMPADTGKPVTASSLNLENTHQDASSTRCQSAFGRWNLEQADQNTPELNTLSKDFESKLTLAQPRITLEYFRAKCETIFNLLGSPLTTQTLDLRQIKWEGLFLKLLAQLYPKAQSLLLSTGSQLTDETACFLPRFKDLSHLDLNGCRKLTDQGLSHLRFLESLRSLKLETCYRITDAGLTYLQGLKNLHTLKLKGCHKITDEGLFQLQPLTSLSSLDLSGCYRITDDGLLHLQGLPSLTSLDLAGCLNITDDGLLHLQGLGNLASLSLGNCNEISDQGLEYLAAVPNLTSLKLADCYRITPLGLTFLLQNSPQLKEVIIDLTRPGLTTCKEVEELKQNFPNKIIQGITAEPVVANSEDIYME